MEQNQEKRLNPNEEVEFMNQMIPLIGYTQQERFKELKASYFAKLKNLDKRKEEDETTKKMLDNAIDMIKTENKLLKKNIIKRSQGHSQFLSLFNGKEQKLKYLHKTPEELIEMLECRLAHCINVYNILVYKKNKVTEWEREMNNEINYLDKLFVSKKATLSLTKLKSEIENAEYKYKMHSFIEQNYTPILSLLDLENRIFPIRIRNAELALSMNQQETKDTEEMYFEAKAAYDAAVEKMFSLQELMEKARKERGDITLGVRKIMAQRMAAIEKFGKQEAITSCIGVADLKSLSLNQALRETRLANYKINDIFGSIKSTLLQTRIMGACETMLENEEMNENQSQKKLRVDQKFKTLQNSIKLDQMIRAKMVQALSNKREECRLANNEMENKIKNLKEQIEEKKKKMMIDGDLLMKVKKATHSLSSKLQAYNAEGLLEGDSVGVFIVNIKKRLDLLYSLYTKLSSPMDEENMKQVFCLKNIIATNLDIAFSTEDNTGALAAFDEAMDIREKTSDERNIKEENEMVMEIDDNTLMVRSYMKAASKRLVAKQKRALGRK